VLGTNTGHVPRHAKVYANLRAELDRVQNLRVNAFRSLKGDVASGAFPEPRHLLEVADREFESFLAGIQ